MDGGLGPTAKMDGMCLVPRKSSVDEGLSDDEATSVAFKGTTKLEKPPKTDEEELKSILLGDSGRWSTQSSSNKRVSFSVDVADSEGMMLLLEDLGRSWTSSSLTLEDSGRWTEQSPKSNSWASAEDKTKDVDNNCEEAKNFEDSGVLATTSTESSTQSPKPHKKKRSRKKKRRLTADEKMKKLSTEYLSLSRRLKSLPSFSPEWTLAKLEMKFISEELEETERKRNDHVASVLKKVLTRVSSVGSNASV